jgi:hypothetical protein
VWGFLLSGVFSLSILGFGLRMVVELDWNIPGYSSDTNRDSGV